MTIPPTPRVPAELCPRQLPGTLSPPPELHQLSLAGGETPLEVI